MITEYSKKLVGKNGEAYRFGEGLVGVYCFSKRIARKMKATEGAVLRQNGDYETVFSVPEKQWVSLTKVLNRDTRVEASDHLIVISDGGFRRRAGAPPRSRRVNR